MGFLGIHGFVRGRMLTLSAVLVYFPSILFFCKVVLYVLYFKILFIYYNEVILERGLGWGPLWAAGGCTCGICWGLWCALVGSICQCVSWVFADVHWGMSMYSGSHCVVLDYKLAGLWFHSLHCGFLLCIGGYAGGHVCGLCVVVCIASFLFSFIFCFFVCVFLGF